MWSLSTCLTMSSQCPWNLHSAESNEGGFCHGNEVTFGKHLKMEAGCQGNQPCDGSIGPFSLPFAGEGLETSQSPRPVIYQRCLWNAARRTPHGPGVESCGAVGCEHLARRVSQSLQRAGSPAPCPEPRPVCLSRP